MDDRNPRLEDALAEVGGSWDPPRTERALRGLKRKRLRRRVARGAAGVAIASVLVWTGVRWSRDTSAPAVVAQSAAQVAADGGVMRAIEPGGIALGEGATVYPVAGAEIEVVASSPQRTEVRVAHGQGRFELAPDRAAQLVVRAGPIEIEVHATEFTVASDREVAEVSVVQGRLEVLWDGAIDTVVAGQQRRFGLRRADPPAPAPAPGADDASDPVRPHRHDWRSLARDGKIEEAHGLLRDGVAIGDDVGDLLLAADVLRISGDAKAAAKPLQKIVSHHPRDPRAPLAAFTLGRVLLDDLGRPVAAAEAFGQARQFAPDGALAEDALAREVEAWSKAGQATTARQRAEEYLERYPHGHRVRAVELYGGPSNGPAR